MDVYRYAFEDEDGNEFGTYTANTYTEACDYAKEHHLRVIELVYEYSDSSIVADYTTEGATA